MVQRCRFLKLVLHDQRIDQMLYVENLQHRECTAHYQTNRCSHWRVKYCQLDSAWFSARLFWKRKQYGSSLVTKDLVSQRNSTLRYVSKTLWVRKRQCSNRIVIFILNQHCLISHFDLSLVRGGSRSWSNFYTLSVKGGTQKCGSKICSSNNSRRASKGPLDDAFLQANEQEALGAGSLNSSEFHAVK